VVSDLWVLTLCLLKSAISNQQSAISNQQSAISNQQSAISNQQSAISNQQSAISNPQLSKCLVLHALTSDVTLCFSITASIVPWPLVPPVVAG
jgi:hypothetical protein